MDEKPDAIEGPGRREGAARAYLEAGAAGLPCAALAVELAQAVLGHPNVQLALQVLEGGPFAHARATELARRIARAKLRVRRRRTRARAG